MLWTVATRNSLKYILLCLTEEKLIQVWNNLRVSNDDRIVILGHLTE